MAEQDLSGIQLAAALSEAVYRRDSNDLPIDLDADLALGSRSFNIATPAGLAAVNDAGTTYYYAPNGFCAVVVEKNNQFWITFRGTDSAEGFAAGFAKAAQSGFSQTAIDGASKTDIGDWTNNYNLGFGTTQHSQLDDALALTNAVISNLAFGDRSKVVVCGQSLGGGLASLVSAVEDVQGFAIAPAPLKDQLAVEATFSALAAAGIDRSAAQALPLFASLSQGASLSRDQAFENGGLDLDTYLSVVTNLTSTARAQIVAAHGTYLAEYNLRLQLNLQVDKITGEVLNDGVGGLGWIVGVDKFDSNLTSYDVGVEPSSVGGLTDMTLPPIGTRL